MQIAYSPVLLGGVLLGAMFSTACGDDDRRAGPADVGPTDDAATDSSVDSGDNGDTDAGPQFNPRPPEQTDTIVGPGATDADVALFDADEDTSLSPRLIYPEDGTMVPPNLNELEFHYAPEGGDVFELHFQGATRDLRVYFTCETVGTGCAYSPDEEVWQRLSDDESGRTPVLYRLRAASRSGGVGASQVRANHVCRRANHRRALLLERRRRRGASL